MPFQVMGGGPDACGGASAFAVILDEGPCSTAVFGASVLPDLSPPTFLLNSSTFSWRERTWSFKAWPEVPSARRGPVYPANAHSAASDARHCLDALLSIMGTRELQGEFFSR